VLAGIGGVTLAAVGGYALAMLLFQADTDGGGTIHQQADVVFTAASDGLPGSTTSVCDTTVHDGDLTVQLEGTQGETCDIDVTLQRVGEPGEASFVRDLEFSDSTTEAFLARDGVHPCNQSGVDGPPVQITAAGTNLRIRLTLDGSTGAFTARPDAGINLYQAVDFVDTLPGMGRIWQGCPAA
jgi:hypothetical protein